MTDPNYEPDPIKVLSLSESLTILDHLERGGCARFSDIETDLELNPAILTRRLGDLVGIGFVVREDGYYKITPEGVEGVELARQLIELVA